MPVEWTRKSWAPGAGGWPTFDEDGKVVKSGTDEDDTDETESPT